VQYLFKLAALLRIIKYNGAQGFAVNPLATAFLASSPAANITEGLEVFVQEVMDAMLT
jgi:hypothetical protein